MPVAECQHCGSSIPDGVPDCPDCGGTARRRIGFRFSTGEIIDNRYEVISRIPGGGMGELYKVRHLHLHDVRAIKILRSDQIGDANYRERFLREARIAASIKHPNVALLHDFATLPDKSFYMVEEFVDGTTLAKSLRGGRRFSLNEIVEIAKQVLLGLGAIHDRGIIHRDISPDNIMLADSPDGGIRVKIIDLGIARSVDPSDAHSLTSAGIFIGKPHYASPEQMRLIEDDAPIDHRTDLYSLGVVLYEVVSGKVPFEASTPFEYLMRQLSGEVDAVDRSVRDLVPPDLESFIVKLLRAKREERFPSTVQALLALSKVRVGAATIQDVPVGEGEAAYPVSPPSRKRRQTAEVPVEQLRRLIEQDRGERGLAPVVFPMSEPDREEAATAIDEFDDSQKITMLQTTPLPRTNEVPFPPPVEETNGRPPSAAEVEDEPVAFVPDLPHEQAVSRPAEPTPAPTPELHPAPPAAAPHRSQSPMAWFVAGIVFVAIVAVGGYLLYRWLEARFGSQPDASVPAATETATPATAASPEPPSTTDSAATAAGDVSAEQRDVSPTRDAPARTQATPAPGNPARDAPPRPVAESSQQQTAPKAPSSRTPREAAPPSTGTAEPPPPIIDTATAADPPAASPVDLPRSTDDVREGDLVAPGPGVTPPEATKTVEPIYPPLSANMGQQGFAMFSVLVGPDGTVEVVKLIVSSGSGPLDKSAEEAAWQTRFKPATKNGVKVRMWKTMRFEFRKTKGF